MMKDESMSTLLSHDDINRIKEIAAPYRYSTHSQLFYEGQTPIVAYLVLEGQINLTKRKRVRTKIGPGHLLGLNELMQHLPHPFAAEVLPKTTVIFLDLSTVKEILQENPSGLGEIFENLLETA